MDLGMKTTITLYNLRSIHLLNALKGLEKEELLRRPSDSVNHMLWIAGHMTVSRCSLTYLMGEQVESPWKDLFSRGAKTTEIKNWPDISKIKAVWRDVSEVMIGRMENLTEFELSNSITPELFRFDDKTLRGAILFRGYHESYHIGQIAYLRKWLGYPSLVG